MQIRYLLRPIVLASVALIRSMAAEHHGQVKFGGLPLPGATVTATQEGKTLGAITDFQGTYSFADLTEGTWTIRVEMLCFEPMQQEVAIKADAAPVPGGESNQAPSDGFLINGSVNNGAASPFGQAAAFGNNRRGPRSLYNGSLGLTFRDSLFDARSFSLTGQDTPKPGYSHVQ